MHLVQRGHDRQPIFVDSRDRHVVLRYIAEAMRLCKVSLHAFVLMGNHVHLLATGHEAGSLSRFMQIWCARYAIYFNRSRRRTGTLYEGRFWSWPVHSERYFLNLMRYIEMNPVRARLCGHPAKFAWSSFKDNVRGEPGPPLVAHPTYLALGRDPAERSRHYRELFRIPLSEEELEYFRDGIRPRPRGRPKRRGDPEKVSDTFSAARKSV